MGQKLARGQCSVPDERLRCTRVDRHTAHEWDTAQEVLHDVKVVPLEVLSQVLQESRVGT